MLTDVSSERAIKALKKAGFIVIRDSRKHTVMARENDLITIPRHKRINPFTIKSIIDDAGLTEEEFKKLL